VGAGWAYALATMLSAFAAARVARLSASAQDWQAFPRRGPRGRRFRIPRPAASPHSPYRGFLQPGLLRVAGCLRGLHGAPSAYVVMGDRRERGGLWRGHGGRCAGGTRSVQASFLWPDTRDWPYVRVPGVSADERNIVFSARIDGLREFLFAWRRAGTVDARVNDVTSGDYTPRHARQSVGHHEHRNLWSTSCWRVAWRSPRDADRRGRMPTDVDRGFCSPVRRYCGLSSHATCGAA
jgi:hypothetical protein